MITKDLEKFCLYYAFPSVKRWMT
ncbi:Protein CBG27630 [Caenorhabditis briggsae]|uniref:Protein CBG27630 n=1 Tax=Caenorhabditis briggsae TaxID=6238 RepID=B6IJ75_CAEBR|nr:Protein CBG27630 [Caenorhabditis briggsae]CAR99909.1 Protein CBG27630 [Caenorhabditis briggsae]